MKTFEFDAEIKRQDDINATFVEFPYDVEQEFGVKGQVKVKAAFDGYEYRGSLAKMGHNCHILGITQKIRAAIGKEPGDKVHVVLAEDDEPRVVEIPEDLKDRLLQNEEALNFFNSLSYTNRKEYVRWINDAKKSETREKRINDAIIKLVDKVKRP